MPYQHATRKASHRENSEDVASVVELHDHLIVLVADGAGGLSGGARAARIAVELVEGSLRNRRIDPTSTFALCSLMSEIDLVVTRDRCCGETTLVVVVLSASGRILGASVGDSEAWIVRASRGINDLTAHQHKKLRLGSGRACPVAFEGPRLDGSLVVATDGLFGCVKLDEMLTIAAGQGSVEQVADRLVELARLPAGGLMDDLALVVVWDG